MTEGIDSFPKTKTHKFSFPTIFFLSASWTISGNSVGAHQQASRVFFPTPSNHSASMLQTPCFWGSIWQDRRLGKEDAIRHGPWSERTKKGWFGQGFVGFEVQFVWWNLLIVKKTELWNFNWQLFWVNFSKVPCTWPFWRCIFCCLGITRYLHCWEPGSSHTWNMLFLFHKKHSLTPQPQLGGGCKRTLYIVKKTLPFTMTWQP